MKKDTSGLKIHYKSLKKEIKQRLRQFSALPAPDYFYELCFCLLTPQSNAKKCWQAVEKLKKCRLRGRGVNSIKIKKTMRHRTLKGAVCKAPCFLDAQKLKAVSYDPILKNRVLISDIEKCLKKNTRFYRNKAKYIKEAVKKWHLIKEKIIKIKGAAELRNWLKKNVKGLGY